MKARALVVALAGALFFPLVATGSFTLPHSFAGPDGEVPTTPLVQGADGFLYGVAPLGGDFTVFPPDGGGTAFRLDGAGNFKLLHVFEGWDGSAPISLIQGRDGFFYGATRYNGIDRFWPGNGTLFRMDSAGNVTTLRMFPGTLEGGAFPGPIVQGADGALYGAAVGGVVTLNVSGGFVYRFDPATGDFRHLHDFALSDGRDPTGPLVQGTDGFFYGTTFRGGPNNTGVTRSTRPARSGSCTCSTSTRAGSRTAASSRRATASCTAPCTAPATAGSSASTRRAGTSRSCTRSTTTRATAWNPRAAWSRRATASSTGPRRTVGSR